MTLAVLPSVTHCLTKQCLGSKIYPTNLVLLILGHEVIHVGLGLGELHLVHALAGVPVQEGLSAEHGGELLTDPLEEFLRSNPS